jgi:hypothetical protein
MKAIRGIYHHRVHKKCCGFLGDFATASMGVRVMFKRSLVACLGLSFLPALAQSGVEEEPKPEKETVCEANAVSSTGKQFHYILRVLGDNEPTIDVAMIEGMKRQRVEFALQDALVETVDVGKFGEVFYRVPASVFGLTVRRNAGFTAMTVFHLIASDQTLVASGACGQFGPQ